MQPAKGSNVNNLIMCVPSKIKVRKSRCSRAKETPKPPASDCIKPSILKALEAVVAAGRRGLLGPAALAAAEAIPDLNVEFYNKEACQATPSPFTVVEESKKKKGKEEEIVTKKCDIVKAVVPSVEGIGNQKSIKQEIWICGNSVISVSRRRARFTSDWSLLGFAPSSTFVYWYGNHTLMWDGLLPLLQQIYHCRSYPSIILIHLGENDLLIDSSCSLVPRMQSDLGILRRALPGVVIIWSSLLPLHIWTSSETPEVMESARNKVNCEMAKYCNETGICYLSHKLITAEKKHLFLRNNTLSNAGADIFVHDLIEALMPYQVCKKC